MDDSTFDLLITKRDQRIESARESLQEAILYNKASWRIDEENERCLTEDQYEKLDRAMTLIDSVMDERDYSTTNE